MIPPPARSRFLLAALALALPPSPSSPARAVQNADGPEPPQAARPASPAEALADRQAIVRDRVSRLEDRMFQLSQALRKSDPEKASRLLESLGALRGKLVRQRIDQIVEKLRTGQFADAADAQQEVAEDLQMLLRLLLEDPSNLEERKEEIERLEAIRKALSAIITEQQRERDAAEAARNAEQRAAALEAAARRVEDLLRRQRGVTADTGRGGPSPADAAKEQAEIRGETEAVARDVRSVAEAQAEASAGGQPSADAPPAGDGPDPGRAAAELDTAMEKMESAEQKLRRDDPRAAKPDQDAATEALEGALEDLEGKAREIRKKLQLEKQAEAQRRTAGKTGDLLKDMKSTEGAGTPGGQEGQDAQGESQPGSRTPGQESVEQAVPHQESAADRLEEEETADALEQQEEALEKLRSAQDELDDRLEQLRKEQQEEFLAALESRFRAMLGRQLECNKATRRLGRLGAENWKRSDQLELADLSQKQRWVGDQADEAYFLLVEEGTTVILPALVEQVRDDAREVADRLAAAEAGSGVRRTQVDIEQLLRDILEAIKKKQEELESAGGGGSGGSAPLLPGSAELKLLRACQLRVNRATERLQVERDEEGADTAAIEAALRRLSRRQADVAEMARDMHEAMKKAQ